MWHSAAGRAQQCCVFDADDGRCHLHIGAISVLGVGTVPTSPPPHPVGPQRAATTPKTQASPFGTGVPPSLSPLGSGLCWGQRGQL